MKKLNTEVQIDRNGCLFLGKTVESFSSESEVAKQLFELTQYDGVMHTENYDQKFIDVKYRDNGRKGSVHLLQEQRKNFISVRLVFSPGFGTGLEVGTEYLESLKNKFFNL